MRAGLITLLVLFSLLLGAEGLFYLMGTYAHMELPTRKELYRAYFIMREVEKKLSSYIPDSDVSRINASAGKGWVEVSPVTADIIKISIDISEKTYGFFDITYGAVSINHKRLKKLSYEEARALVDFRKIKIDDKKVFLEKEGMALDLGGIGKGYAVELAYKKLGSEWGFIGIAGDMKTWGRERVLAIKDPLRGGSLLQVLARGEICLSTSGNYHKRHIEQGDSSLVQVTVAHRNCAYADGFATALLAMPRTLRRKFEKENPQVGIVEVYRNGGIYINKAFRELFPFLIIKDDIESH